MGTRVGSSGGRKSAARRGRQSRVGKQKVPAASADMQSDKEVPVTKIAPRKNRLAVLRAQSKLTQLEVAKLMDADFTTVSKHESGTRGLTQREINKYAAIFKVSSYELFIEPEQRE